MIFLSKFLQSKAQGLMQNVIIFWLYLIQHSKLENFCIFVISNNKSLISQNLKVVSPLGRKFNFSVHRDLKFKAILITEPQKSSSTHGRVLKRYLNEKHLIHGRVMATISKFSPLIFETYFRSVKGFASYRYLKFTVYALSKSQVFSS